MTDRATKNRNDEQSGLDVCFVSFSFGSGLALKQVSIAVAPSEFCVLLGLNGAGKTTLFSLITRLRSASEGTINIFGHDLQASPRPALQKLGVVFQDRTLDLDLSVLQNLKYHGALYGMSRASATRRALEELSRLGMADLANDKVRHLSGGQMRRVEIARALLHEPTLLLLDEPTAGLDIETRQAISDHVNQLCQDKGVAVLWATHLIDEVKGGGTVILLDQGSVISSGIADDIIHDVGASDMHDAFKKLIKRHRA